MAHELLIENGAAAMMYVGEVPWHGLGKQLTEPPTAGEAIKAAGLDWRVRMKPVCTMADGIWYEIPDRYAIVREDKWGAEDCPVFATVSENYVPLQNEEAFGFFDGLITRKLATYETAGALGNGERVWVMAKLKDDIYVAGKDRLQPYIMLANGHNAATAVRVVLTPIRVVCQNTLNWAIRTTKSEFRIHHGRDMHKKLQAVSAQLDAIVRQYEILGQQFNKMAQRPMLNTDLPTYLEEVFPTPDQGRHSQKSYERIVEEVKHRRAMCSELSETGRGNAETGIRGSLWAAYNGVTDWADHRMRFANRFHRFGSLFFGESARIKTRALGRALNILGDKQAAAEIESANLN